MWSNLHEVVMWFFFFTLSPRLESARPFSPMTLTLPWNWWGWAASFVEICLQCIFDSCWFCLSWLWNFNWWEHLICILVTLVLFFPTKQAKPVEPVLFSLGFSQSQSRSSFQLLRFVSVRSASASLAKLTGQPRAVARAALDALNEAGKTEKLDSARFS